MTEDLTRDEIEALVNPYSVVLQPYMAQAITQLLRQVDAAEAKTEAHRQALMATENGLTIADYEEVLADKRRLVREMDVALHGEQGAAKQASLCDLIGPALALRAERDAETARADAAAEQMRERCVAACRNFIANNWPNLTEREIGAYNALLALRAISLHEEPQT